MTPVDKVMIKPNVDLSQLQVFILGDGVFAKELKTYYEQLGVTVPTLIPQSEMDWYRKTVKTHQVWTILGAGHPDIKRKMAEEANGKFASFIHPRSIVCIDTKRIGEGSVIAPGAVIAPHAKLGKHVLVNYNATIGHDTVVGDFGVISPNAAVGGSCFIGNGVYVGAGATIKEGLTIADDVTIGMGAAVVKDILEPGITVVGVPAKQLKKEQNDK